MSRYSQRTLVQQPSLSNWGKTAGSSPVAITKAFYTSSTTWVCPAGVSFVNVRMSGGGGGTGFGATGGTGGTSSFSGSGITTFSCVGGAGTRQYYSGDGHGVEGLANSGLGSQIGGQNGYTLITQSAQNGLVLEQGIDVTAGTTYTVTVGAGGTAGGSGQYVGGGGFIELMYQAGTPSIKRRTFIAAGTFTVPATAYAVRATVVGGAGGVSDAEGTRVQGGTSSAAFASGTISALGGHTLGNYNRGPNWTGQGYNGLANSGKAGRTMWTGGDTRTFNGLGGDGQVNQQWVSVTPLESVTVTVGASGGGNHCSGGSGYVTIEWME